MFRIISFLAIGVLIGSEVPAAEVKVAVASNFSSTLNEISAAFKKETGHTLIISSGASGKFFSQIREGAPFEVFLSADPEHPKKLLEQNLAVKGTDFIYAVGKLVLWSSKENFVDPQGKVLQSTSLQHIAIANPELAPYGKATQEFLERKGLWTSLRPKMVVGENIAQTFHFVSTGNADLGFIAYSQIKDTPSLKGSYWIVPQDLYKPLQQVALLLKTGDNNAAAKRFLDFLKSKEAKSIIAKFGYGA